MFDTIGGSTALFATIPATVLRSALRAVLPAASTDRTNRARMAGVLLAFEGAVLEGVPHHTVEIVATDGHRLTLVRATWAAAEPCRTGRVFLPRPAAEGLIKALGSAKACAALSVGIAPGAAALSDGRVLPIPAAAEGEFPPYRKVIQDIREPHPRGVRANSRYLSAAVDAAEEIGAESVDLRYGGELEAIRLDAKAVDGPVALELVAIVMPMRR